MYRMMAEGITQSAMETAMNQIPKCDLSLFKEEEMMDGEVSGGRLSGHRHAHFQTNTYN